MEIIFIRHTEKEEFGEDPYLTKKGIKQAGYLANKLKKIKNFNEFYCSDLNRAKETAKIISKKIKIKPKTERSLNEFKSEIIKESKSKWRREEKSHYKELIFFLKKITKNPKDKKSILIIAHGLTNRIILSYFLNLNLKNIIQFRQSEGGFNSIYWIDKFKNWRLKIWNDNNHIPEKLRYNKDAY
ncbi:MAG TPA: histidine phosphatase family protein [Candidatus Nanoarchaeia archaeon]|nr:histidine phosphatase family protein [Candidatus Nanoarchaeia archaeon]